QKMDAIGQLTGGVAHDFNNILTVILGAGESLLDHLADAPSAIRGQAETIVKASERAASLTHRLLAFARKQPLDPRPTAINPMLAEVEDILRRLLGENIHIELVRGGGCGRPSSTRGNCRTPSSTSPSTPAMPCPRRASSPSRPPTWRWTPTTPRPTASAPGST